MTAERYWSHEEIGEQASGLERARQHLCRAAEELRVLPSMGGLAGGIRGLEEVAEDVERAGARVGEESERATDAAVASYVEECEREGGEVWRRWEEQR